LKERRDNADNAVDGLSLSGNLIYRDITAESAAINQIFPETLGIVPIERNAANEGDLKAGLSNDIYSRFSWFFIPLMRTETEREREREKE